MAQHNTDYGLVYDDDGKICVTKRTDVVPFPGVTSYAVETGTTNLVQNPQFLNGTANYGSNNFGGTGYCEVVNNIMNMHNESGTTNLALLQSFTIDNTKEHTISCRVRSANGQDCPIIVYFGVNYYNIGTAPASGAWVTLERTYVPGELTASPTMHFLITSGKYLQIDWLQFEQKPFASSFVNGSRPKGRLVVDIEDLGFNPGTDDWVVSYRKYPIMASDNTLTGENISSFGLNNQGYYFFWGKYNNENRFILRASYNDGSGNAIYSPIFNPDDYFRRWHSEVILKHDGIMEYWVDGVLQCQGTLTSELVPNYGTVGLSLGGYSGMVPSNSLFANITYGKYTDQWTPEYIQRISAMTSTFYVPTKRVIV